MVRVITVEREYGSEGAEFAHRLAARLQWKLIDRCLVEEIAQKVNVPPRLVENCDERLDPWYYKLGKAFWHGSVEHMPPAPASGAFDSERMTSLVRDYLQDAAATGHCVIVGRGAACALSVVPGVFNIFVYASLTRKLRWFEEHFPDHADDARRELEATDARRENYIRRYYDQDWTDRRLYHLMLNSCMGFDAMVEAAIDGAGLAQR